MRNKTFIPVVLTAGLTTSLSAQAEFIDLVGQFESGIANRVAVVLNQRYNNLQQLGCVIPRAVDVETIERTDDTFTEAEPNFAQTADGQLARAPVDVGFEEGCTGRSAQVFANIDALIQTGNALTLGEGGEGGEGGQGPTFNSLGLDINELNDALIWLAAEEYAAQGDLSRDFSSNQAKGLSTRLSALRIGASGFSLGYSHNGYSVDSLALSEQALTGTRGGAAGSKTDYSPLGGYFNLQFSDGSRDDSDLENAFDISGINLNAGIDYRLNNRWTTGINVGYTDQEVEFDPNKSVVDGGIDSDGFSFMPFVMYQQGQFFSSLALGLQQLSFDSSRAIRYADVDTRSVGQTDGDVTSVFAEIGYSFSKGKYSFEPFLNLNSSDVSIDSFVERDVNNSGYDVAVDEQNFDLLDITFGLTTQAVFSSNNKVYAPYFSVEFVNQRENEARTVSSNFFSGAQFADSTFALDSQELDSSYRTFTLGVSGVLRGSSQKVDGGVSSGEVQGYAEIKTINGFTNYSLTLYSLGLRMSF